MTTILVFIFGTVLGTLFGFGIGYQLARERRPTARHPIRLRPSPAENDLIGTVAWGDAEKPRLWS